MHRFQESGGAALGPRLDWIPSALLLSNQMLENCMTDGSSAGL